MKQLITFMIIVFALAATTMASFDFNAIRGTNEFMSRQDYFSSGLSDFSAWPTSDFSPGKRSSGSWTGDSSQLPFPAYSVPESLRLGHRGSYGRRTRGTQLDWNNQGPTRDGSWDSWHKCRPKASVVPVPGSIILGTFGVAIIGYLRKRKTI